MKCIIENTTNLIVYFGNEVELLEDRIIVDGCVDMFFNSSTVTEIDGVEKPLIFTGRAYEYQNGAVVLVDDSLLPKPIVEPTVVPQMLTPRQARLALLGVGLLDEVEVLLANDRAMQIWWEYSLDIQRNHEHTVAMAGALGLTEVQLDELFIEGAKL